MYITSFYFDQKFLPATLMRFRFKWEESIPLRHLVSLIRLLRIVFVDVHNYSLKFSLAAVVLGLGASWYSLAGATFEIVMLVIAASPRIPLYWYVIIGAVAGFSLRLEESLSGKEKFIGLFGSACGIYFFYIYPIAFSIYCSKKTWLQIGVRILGSWVAASALLVLALSMSSVLS